nr:putative peptide modification system cyclase [Arenimonas sp.]
VLAGAKAFEVEGLAKPVAARLMNLALPGQILMSGMAQTLCHRAVGELGDAGARLRWLMHGRYSFKGVPAPMLVHEVGEPGLSPLRAPESGTKAWRELPLWRRPPVIALEVVLLAALGLGFFWTTLRSPPAIAFAERDWVVVADLQNRTGDAIFDDSLDTALRVGLEQSRHVNLVSDLQIGRALERMKRQGQPVDRQLAAELALREGAKAVILPTVAQVGGLVRVSLEVIDPASGVTVYSHSADAAEAGQVLPALDQAMAVVRNQLGEAMTSVERSTKPLEQVTTGNLEALKAFSLGLSARFRAEPMQARALFGEAVRLDPKFAMAYLQLAFMSYVDNDAVQTRYNLDLALANRANLSQRELLFLEGAEATLADPARSLEKFRLMATLYPDEGRGPYNYAYFAHNDLLRSEDGLAVLEPFLQTKHDRPSSTHYLAGVIHLALNRFPEALAAFERSDSFGLYGSRREFAEAHAAQRNFSEAERVLAQQPDFGDTTAAIEARQIDMSMALDRGRLDQALATARELEARAQGEGIPDLTRNGQSTIALWLRSYRPDAGFAEDLRAFVRKGIARLPDADSLERRHTVFQLMAAAWMAAHTGDGRTARAALEATAKDPLMTAYPANLAMQRAVRAELALAAGDAPQAVALLAPGVERGEGLYFERAVLMRARAANEQWAEALALSQWLASNRGRAYAEASSLGIAQPANVLESSLALDAAAYFAGRVGDADVAREAAEQFRQAWAKASPEAQALAAKRRPAR